MRTKGKLGESKNMRGAPAVERGERTGSPARGSASRATSIHAAPPPDEARNAGKPASAQVRGEFLGLRPEVLGAVRSAEADHLALVDHGVLRIDRVPRHRALRVHGAQRGGDVLRAGERAVARELQLALA